MTRNIVAEVILRKLYSIATKGREFKLNLHTQRSIYCPEISKIAMSKKMINSKPQISFW